MDSPDFIVCFGGFLVFLTLFQWFVPGLSGIFFAIAFANAVFFYKWIYNEKNNQERVKEKREKTIKKRV